jgi:hypothetical protein
VPRLSTKYPVAFEIISKPRDVYSSDEWAETELPCAPAIMIGDDVIVEGKNISEDELESKIKKRLC